MIFMKILNLALDIVKYLFSLLKYWKIILVAILSVYFIFLFLDNKSTKSENLRLYETINKQDSTIANQEARILVDSINFEERKSQLQVIVDKLNKENKSLKVDVSDRDSVILGKKCYEKKLFSRKIKIVDC